MRHRALGRDGTRLVREGDDVGRAILPELEHVLGILDEVFDVHKTIQAHGEYEHGDVQLAFRGGTLRIRVERESARAIYPKGYSFGGRDFREPWISARELEKGGELVFRLADRPGAASPLPDWY